MTQLRVFLVVSSLGTDREGEVIHYQIGAPRWRFRSSLVKRLTDEPYRVEIGQVPDYWKPELQTPDARLALVLEAIEPVSTVEP